MDSSTKKILSKRSMKEQVTLTGEDLNLITFLITFNYVIVR